MLKIMIMTYCLPLTHMIVNATKKLQPKMIGATKMFMYGNCIF